MNLFKRTTISERQELAVQKTVSNLRIQRAKRFRILSYVRDAEDSMLGVRMAAQLAPDKDCDIIIVTVRSIDQGLRTGGLQVRVARQNMMDAGLELPGIRFLKTALDVLEEEGISVEDWERKSSHEDVWHDPLGDNKIVYTHENGRSVVLKLKTAPDPASGILDQFELGPYNLIILGEPKNWRSEISSWFDSGVIQRVTVLARCSVLVTRDSLDLEGFFICTDGTPRSMQAVKRSAVLAHATGQPITLFSVAAEKAKLGLAEENVRKAKALLMAVGIDVKETLFTSGHPADEIIKAGNSYRVIVVSDEGRTRVQRLLRGSVAYDVVRDAKTSVLDVR